MDSITQKEENSKKKGEIIKLFINNCGVRILDFEFLIGQQRRKNCCSEEKRLLIYQKEDRSLGKMNFCCEKKLVSEIQRISKLLQKEKRSVTERYKTSYKMVRGSIGQILLQASFGINTRIYTRENELVKEHSILRNINYLLESCSIEEWNSAIEDFQKNPHEKSVERIVKLYSPLFRDDQSLVFRMAGELIIFLENVFRKWKGSKKRIVDSHLGARIIINETLVNFKFTEHKLSFQKTYFEDLYRNYHSICKSNPYEKKRIKKLAVFSPITRQLIELEVEEAITKWKLKRDFSRNFTLWQLKNYINISKNNIFIADRIERSAELAIETNNPFFREIENYRKKWKIIIHKKIKKW